LEEYVIGLDLGTQQIKILIVDREGNIVYNDTEVHPLPFSLQIGWAEQHPTDWWNTLIKLTKKIKKILLKKVVAIGFSVQRSAVIPIDRRGIPLRPAITWMDFRTPSPEKEPKLASKILWIKENEPEIYDKAYKFVDAHAWLAMKLTGNAVSSHSSLPRELINPEKFDYNYEIIDFLNIREKVPDLLPPGEVLGYITKTASEETGLPEGLPVVVGAGDKQCETLGTGCIRPNMAMVSCGTAATIGKISFKFVKSPHFIVKVSAIPGAWNPEAGNAGFSLYSWFIKQFGIKGRKGLPPEEIMDAMAAKVRPGAEGLILLPHCQLVWPGGDIYQRGAILGWSISHTSGHFYRMLLEGIAYNLRVHMENMEKALGQRIEEIRVCGGGARSNLTARIFADIFGKPVVKTLPDNLVSYAGAMGAAIDAAKGGGLYKSVGDAANNMVHPKDSILPNNNIHEFYNKLYEVFKEIEPSVRELHVKLVKYSSLINQPNFG